LQHDLPQRNLSTTDHKPRLVRGINQIFFIKLLGDNRCT
jgi:hypothetical protein